MRFWLEHMVLWYRTGGTRKLEFKNNVVNVVTGDSNTGKTAILQIFDYCFFASQSKLPESAINENVLWYGIRFHINGKIYTIARTALSNGKVTNEYYFSSTGKIPDTPEPSHDESTLKAIIETEFGIDRNVTVPFGGQTLRLGSKISLRFFLLFTTISEDIITSSSVFFDKQNQNRYAEALHRVFDLAVGIESPAVLIAKEERSKISQEVKRLKRQLSRLSAGKRDFKEEQDAIVRQAKELGAIAPDLAVADAAGALRNAVESAEDAKPETGVSQRQSEIRTEIALKGRIVRNLKILQGEIDDYRKLLGTVEDSLRPIEFLQQNSSELIQTSVFASLFSMIERDFIEVKRDIRDRVPIDANVGDLIDEHERSIESLMDEQSSLPQEANSFETERERLLFLGLAKAKLELYGGGGDGDYIAELNSKLESVEASLKKIPATDAAEEREMFLKLLEEVILEYVRVAGPALANYQDYLPVFDYKNKVLQLRKPRTAFIENVGSSSNHMFLHLFLFLGLHEAVKINGSPFVPPFLIIDQPSRPYWGDSDEERKTKLDDTDEQKMRKAFEVMDRFVNRVVSQNDDQCQLIVFEHVPPSTWDGLDHVHLVERFINGNALVRFEDLE